MADIMDGVNIEISVEDNASDKLSEIEAKVQNACENAAKSFNAMSAASAALNGNILGLAKSLAPLVNLIRGIRISAMGLSVIGAVIGGAVTIFNKWRDSVRETKAKLEELRDVKFNEHLADIKSQQEALTAEIEKTCKAIDRQLEIDRRDLDYIKEKTKAQIELNRQKALEGKDEGEKQRINANADAQLAAVDRQSATAKIDAEINANASKAEALEKMLEKYEGVVRQVTAVTTDAGRTFLYSEGDDINKLLKGEKIVSATGDTVREGGLIDRLRDQYQFPAKEMSDRSSKLLEEAVRERVRNAMAVWQVDHTDAMPEDYQREEKRVRSELKRRVSASNAFQSTLLNDKEYQAAKKRAEDIAQQLEIATKASERIKAAINDAADKDDDLQQKRDLEQEKAQIAIQAEANTLRAISDMQDRKDDERLMKEKMLAAEMSQTRLGSAEARLDAAKSAVDEAWGWYKDPESLKNHDAAFDADSAARERYRKDLHSITHGRRAGDLSYMMEQQRLGHDDEIEERFAQLRKSVFFNPNQEATMRVALAERRETDANNDLLRAADAATRAADSLANIEAAFNGGED